MRKWEAQQAGSMPADPGGRDSAFREARGDRLDAQRGGSARQTGGVGMLLRHVEDFDLTEEQQDRLNKLRVGHELEKVDLRAAVSKAKIVLRSLLRDLEAPEKDVMAAIDKLAKCEANLRKMRYGHLQAARAVLNEEQQRRLKTYHQGHLREKIKAFSAAKNGTS
jgi:hypothetical protein